MAHTLVIGGQPDWLTSIVDDSGNVFGWSEHGREIEAGDAEKVLDLAPSTVYRAKSVCSGEFAPMLRNYGSQLSLNRGIAAIVHNLADVDAKLRVTEATATVISRVAPVATVAQSNSKTSGGAGAATYQDVDQDPFGTITTFAEPSDQTLPWSLEVGFDNATTLYTGVADSQVIWVYLQWVGTYILEDTALVTITVKEGATPRAQKQLRIRPSDGETFITSVLVDPTEFSVTTLNNMSVEVALGAVTAGKYWTVRSIYWQKHIHTGTSYDSGWVSVESPTIDLYTMSADVPIHTVIPYLDGSGDVYTSLAAQFTYFQFYWDDSINTVTAGRPRIFFDPDHDGSSPFDKIGTPTNWRPEIGLIAEGPAYGTNVEFGPSPSWTDPSIVRMSKGGNDWVIRRTPRRRLLLAANFISAADYAGSLFSVMRRAGVFRPFCVAFKPGSSFNAAVTAAVSMYGRLLSFNSSNPGVTTAAPGDGYWRVDMTFEEVT